MGTFAINTYDKTNIHILCFKCLQNENSARHHVSKSNRSKSSFQRSVQSKHWFVSKMSHCTTAQSVTIITARAFKLTSQEEGSTMSAMICHHWHHSKTVAFKGKTTVSDRHQIRVRVRVSSRVRVAVRFGSLFLSCSVSTAFKQTRTYKTWQYRIFLSLRKPPINRGFFFLLRLQRSILCSKPTEFTRQRILQ